MAKLKKGRKAAKKRTGKRAPARRTKKSVGRKAGAGATDRRVRELEAENGRLRDEIAALRAEREDRPAGEPAADRPPTLEF